MALAFHHRLAIPLWAVAFFAVVLTAPPPGALFPTLPTTLFVIAAVGIAAIIFSMPRAIPSLRTSHAIVPHLRAGRRGQATAAITMAAGTCVRTLVDPTPRTADDALDLVRMDDDGGWQMARPPA